MPGAKANAPQPIADADPKTTAFLKEVITRAARGETDPEWLTPQFQAFLLPDRIKQGPQMMGRLGDLTGFELMEDTTRNDLHVRIYRATLGTTPLRVQFTLAADGKIAGLGVSSDN